MKDILKIIIAKYNELESMKQYLTDEVSLNVIKAKQDTLDDIYKVIDSKWTEDILI